MGQLARSEPALPKLINDIRNSVARHGVTPLMSLAKTVACYSHRSAMAAGFLR
jgi:hypothetical protein